MKRLLILILLLIAWVAPAWAADYYAHPTGSATWAASASIETPCSLATAMLNAVAGDTVLLRGGNYVAPVTASAGYTPAFQPANSGTLGNPITFQAYPGEIPFIDNAANQGLDTVASFGSYYDDFIVWDGLHTKAIPGRPALVNEPPHAKGVILFNSHNNVVKNCDIEGFGEAGSDNNVCLRIEVANDALIENNVMYGANGWGLNSSALETYQAHDMVFRNNTIYDCYTGVLDKNDGQNNIYTRNYVYDCTIGILVNVKWVECVGNKVYQNIIRNTGDGTVALGMMAAGEGDTDSDGNPDGYATNFLWYNNTIYSGGGYGISTDDPVAYVSGTEVFNNLVVSMTTPFRVREDTYAYFANNSEVNDFVNSGGTAPEDYKRTSYPTDGRGDIYATVMGAYITGDEIIGAVPLIVTIPPTGAVIFNPNVTEATATVIGTAAADLGHSIVSVELTTGAGSVTGTLAWTVSCTGLVVGDTPYTVTLTDDQGASTEVDFTVTRSASGPTIYYVDQAHASDSDSNPGTEASPWATIQHAADVMVAGDTVFVKAGTYPVVSLTLARSGTAENPITFQNFEDDVVVVDGAYQGQWAVVDWVADRDYIVWDGINVTGGSNVGVRILGDHNTIRNSKIYGMNQTNHSGLVVSQGDYNTVEYNEIYNNYNAISIADCNYTEVRYNIARDNPGHTGINFLPDAARVEQLMWQGNSVHHNISTRNNRGLYSRYQQNFQYYNNILYDNIATGINFDPHPTATVEPRTWRAYGKIYNNTIVGNGTNGIESFGASDLTIKNNLLASNSNFDLYINSPVSTNNDIDYNLYHDSLLINVGVNGGVNYTSLAALQAGTVFEAYGLSGDPLFTDAVTDDYTLLEGSPAINAGTDLTAAGVTSDIDDTARPIGAVFDIGAYESAVGETPTLTVVTTTQTVPYATTSLVLTGTTTNMTGVVCDPETPNTGTVDAFVFEVTDLAVGTTTLTITATDGVTPISESITVTREEMPEQFPVRSLGCAISGGVLE